MSANDLVLIVLVAAGAFYAGYQVGRLKTLAERGQIRPTEDTEPLPGPRLDLPAGDRARPRAAPPPVSAGSGNDVAANRSAPPRRSTKPPPAAAGLMGTGDKSQD
jgi:hypothetical protein